MRVNGRVAELGCKVLPGRDAVLLGEQPVEEAAPEHLWVMLHKPLQVVTTRSDERGRETVMDLLAEDLDHLFPVGRLDVMTTGLLLLTNDGVLANRLLHPRNHVPKTYLVRVDRALDRGSEEELARGGLELDGRPLSPAEIEYLGREEYEITIREGRNRQVRRMFEAVGAHVRRLHRIRFGPLWLEDLPCERYRELGVDEVRSLEDMLDTH